MTTRQVEIDDADARRLDDVFRTYLGATLGAVYNRGPEQMTRALDEIAKPALDLWQRFTGHADQAYARDLEGWVKVAERPWHEVLAEAKKTSKCPVHDVDLVYDPDDEVQAIGEDQEHMICPVDECKVGAWYG